MKLILVSGAILMGVATLLLLNHGKPLLMKGTSEMHEKVATW